jgi:acetylornithine/N-succinyldiaminopimelate aminotransferase
VKGQPVGDIIRRALDNGLVVISAGSDVLRLVPPLVITRDDIDEMIVRLEKSL